MKKSMTDSLPLFRQMQCLSWLLSRAAGCILRSCNRPGWFPAGFRAGFGRVAAGLAASMLLLGTASADVESADVEKLDALLADIETFQADVRQLIVESDGGVLEESQIVFKLKRPDGFYWETLEPFPELIVTDGESLWNYQPDLWQVTIEDWDSGRSELAAQLLHGQVDAVAEEYSVSGTRMENGKDWEFMLEPYDAGSLYERVTLYFEDGALESIHIDSGSGQKTLWQFYNRRINDAIPDELFVFTMPDDEEIEVLDNRNR